MNQLINILVVISIFTIIYADLSFNSDGKFKIVQFTDIHVQNCVENDIKSQNLMKTILDKEKPDLVIITGDLISGFLLKPDEKSEVSWACALKPILEGNYPYAFVFGNHDHEHNLNREGIYAYDKTLGKHLSLTKKGPEDVAGLSNYYLLINSSESQTPAHILWFLDTHQKVPKNSNMENMDTLHFSQVNWYYEQSKQIYEKYGILRGSMWFHIPLPEYETQWFCSPTKGHMEDWDIGGPFVNSGIYNAALERQDVDHMFCGHAHMCDFEGLHHGGIKLHFGRSTGFSGYGDLPKGARVIELTEWKREIETWVYAGEEIVEQPYHDPEEGRCYFRPYKPIHH
eukprot:TRINITY_DN2424_c0_g1_i1.p1 TRINITY_DN2424_c0_g1~~TRINITY_DN2424_c0_g1_i1.p1  ORF type:complete len:342 (+),score=85.04 TRINITY_DN2424_c0_g1_i1:27-1052(+)